ncbi:hypothetical protein EAH79_05790 [Sphingomonas koreensis]|nr:hypothetical protein EAH79_05790 [Sphingomonas koreensis]
MGERVFTEGGLISPGATIPDIVPDAAPLVVKAEFDPADIDGVGEGMPAEARLARAAGRRRSSGRASLRLGQHAQPHRRHRIDLSRKRE